MINPQYPQPDPKRKDRIIDDVMSLMKLREQVVTGTGAMNPRDQVCRWLEHTLRKAQRSSELPWWFARRSYVFTVYAGQDVFDLKPGIDKLLSLQCKYKLQRQSMDCVSQRRAESYNSSNSGEPRFYCSFGGRLHLYPAPDKKMLLSVLYTVPLTCEIIPDEWETLLVDGVIGLYGRHFDRSGMLGDTEIFEQRFWRGLDESRDNNHDSNMHYRYKHHHNYTVATLPTLSQALAETAAGNPPDDAIITPAYQAEPGAVQILADDPENNQPGEPVAQIPGDDQP